jgi:hypothetical protein
MIRSKLRIYFERLENSLPQRLREMAFFFAALALLLHLVPGGIKPSRAQSSRKDDIVFNSRGTPLAGATVRVCSMPTSGQPCTPLAQIYSDSALTQALANPTATDGLGNYFFYAAPGKYMIEISGPGITTKQIPNVILPSDPTNPSFSGGISAFSLNLTGSLTVNGSASVIGNLASGTLNLSNQATPPVSSGAGTVNLYTKSSDKKLYYIDETGTETGPLGVGGGGASPAGNNGDLQSKSGPALQASGVNDNGSTLAINRDQQSAGPNPHFDIRAFGGYISASPPATTGSITGGSSTLAINAAGDYANGQGIVVYGAGAATALTTPGTPTVTPNLLNGATTWNYKVIAEDYKGGLTAASSAGTTAAGSSALGLTSFSITSATRTSGVATYTTSAPHNLQTGQTVFICQFGGGTCPATFADLFNGTKVVQSTPTSTTFTTLDGNTADAAETPAAGQGWVKACNTLTFPAGSFSGTGTLRYWIYRSQGAGAYSLAGVAIGLDPYFVDCGGTAPSTPGYIPSTPPASPQTGYLATTIASGGGTTTLTLAANAGVTVTGAFVLHDNSSALLAAMTAAANQGGGTVYIPSFGPGVVFWSFNASTDMNTVSSANSNYITILVNGNVGLNQPWILRSNINIQGMTKRNSSFMYPGGANFGGAYAYPLLYLKTRSAITLRNLLLNGSGAQSTDLFSDTDGSNNGSVGIILENVGLAANSNNGVGTARNVVIKAGFDYFFRQVTCDPASGSSYLPSPCIDFTDSSPAVESPSQMAGRIAFDTCYIDASGIRISNVPNPNTNTGDFRITGVLAESMFTPFLRIGPAGLVTDIHLTDVLMADQVAGAGTPFVDASGSQLQGIAVTGGLASNINQPLVISGFQGTSMVGSHQPTDNPGNVPYFAMRQKSGSPLAEVSNQPLVASGSGRLNYALALPGAPSSCVVSAGGTVPVGTQSYALTAVDFDGNETTMGVSAFVTTSSGNQTVTCNLPSLPNGAAGFNVYRNAFRIVAGGICTSPQISGTSFTDGGTGCGNSAPQINGAGSSFVSSSGISTYQLRLGGDALTGTTGTGTLAVSSRGSSTQGHLPTFDANSNLIDAGISPTNVSDFFNRASSNLGSESNSPWTVVAGTLLVTAGGVGGNTGGQNYAVFTGVGFPNDDQTASATWIKTGTPSSQVNSLVLRGSPTALTNYTCQPANNGTSLTIAKFISGSFTSLATQSTTINSGDTISFNITGTSLNCYVNGAPVAAATDSSISSGFPGLGGFQLYNANGANLQWKNWMASPGYVSLQRPQTWSQLQTFTPGIALGSETISASPRGFLNAFRSGALTSTWTGSTVTLDKAVTITRVQVQAKTAPSGCSTNAIVRLTDGTTPVSVTISGAANDSGAITQNYAAGASLTISVQTAAAGCTTAPADANAIIQYKMQ